MPLLNRYTYCETYNGVADIAEWLDKLDRYLAVLNCFDSRERTDALRRRIIHLPCYVHVRDCLDHNNLCAVMRRYYGIRQPGFYLAEPKRDGLPRYHDHEVSQQIQPYNGTENIQTWILQFEVHMTQKWCDDDSDRLLWLRHYLGDLMYHGDEFPWAGQSPIIFQNQQVKNKIRK